MKLRCKRFERAAKTRIRSELRASETLWNDYKQARKRGRRLRHISPIFYRLLFMAMIGTRVFTGTSIHFIIALAVLWTLAMFFWRATQLASALYDSPSLPVFNHLPISDENIFKIQFRFFLRRSLWSALDFSICYWALIAKSGIGSQALVAGIGFGVVHWLFVFAGTLVLFAFGPLRFVPALGWLLAAGAVIFGIFGEKQDQLMQWLTGIADWIPPVGWILRAIGVTASTGTIGDFLPALIGAIILCLAPMAYRRAEQNYVSSIETIDFQMAETAEEEKAFAQHATEEIKNREFLRSFDWSSAGFVERQISHLLNPREKTIVEFLVAGSPDWTKLFRNLVGMWAALLVGIFFFAGQLRSSNGWLVYAALFLAWLLFTNLVGTWSGFACASGLGPQSPIFAHYPISFLELTKVMLKVNVARLFLYVPAFLTMSIAAGALLGKFSIVASLLVTYGLKILFLLLCAQPIMIMTPISPATDDTKKLGFTILVVIAILVLLGCGTGFFFAKDWRWVSFFGLFTAGVSVSGLYFYARRFNHSKFDLVPLATNEAAPE